MSPNPQRTADLVALTEELVNGIREIYLPLMHLKILKFINFVRNYNFSDKKKKPQNNVGNNKL